jgi:hypothetical protein
VTVRDQVEEHPGVELRRREGDLLRLVGRRNPGRRAAGAPLTGATDPRWVLAVRVAEQLDGPVLPPERRDRLIRLGKVMGLSDFDANLVIAIVQDQARRGFAPEACPAAGEEQLRFVPLPRREEDPSQRLRRWLITGALVATIIALESMILRTWF